MSQFDAFGTPGGSQGDGSAAGNGSSLAGVSSSNNGSTAAALASKSNQNILTFYKNPSLLYDMARQGRMSQAQATQVSAGLSVALPEVDLGNHARRAGLLYGGGTRRRRRHA
jgi:hypothetical protein